MSTALADIDFDYDRSQIREDARAILMRNAANLKGILSDFPSVQVLLEGHSDDRGSAEYNLGLGDLRAETTRELIVEFGVPSERLEIISYGKERPGCAEMNESCWHNTVHISLLPRRF